MPGVGSAASASASGWKSAVVAGNIFLVGLMGAGKTTVGKALAKRLNKRFVDSDHEIEARTGATIPLIFEIEGEASFRRREAEVIRELTAQDDIVLATGGGAVLNPDSRALLKERGTVIYLRASVGNLLQRTSHDRNRPLLQKGDPRRTLEELTRVRDPLYNEVADFIIDTGRPNVQFLMQSILSQLDQGMHKQAADTSAQQTSGPASSVMTLPSSTSQMLHVDLGERSYPITIGHSLLDDPAIVAAKIPGNRVAVVTNTVVAPLYLEQLCFTLAAAGKKVTQIILP